MAQLSLAKSKFLFNIHRYPVYLLVILLFMTGAHPVSAAAETGSAVLSFTSERYRSLNDVSLESWVGSLVLTEEGPVKEIHVAEPLAGTILPRDMASIAFIWEDPAESSAWMLTIKSSDGILARAILDRPWWIPDQRFWEALKQKAAYDNLSVTLTGIGGWSGREILSSGRTSFGFSRDSVNAWLMFMRKPLPFLNAKNNPGRTELLAGDISAFERPENILPDTPICANCHAYSVDGRAMTMDMDYGGDKGGFLLMDLQADMVIEKKDVFSWNNLEAVTPAAYSMGLFARMSPDGRYVAGTVNETSVFIMMDNLWFSQLFYPATGHIAVYDRRLNRYNLLPGASETTMVQTSPDWSPAGKTLAFAAAPTRPELIRQVLDKVILDESSAQTIDVLNRKYPVQFDIYTVPFNDGAGGEALPLEGASRNGFSNYFPRYSPDGKWLVFTQSPTGLVLQPDSLLYIVPAAGGTARPLNSNQPVMNSWHSWSPNSRWIVFTCKANSPFTELYLTHIDDHGVSSPAIRLFRFSHNDMAAMVPEFIPRSAGRPAVLKFDSPEAAVGKSMATDGR